MRDDLPEIRNKISNMSRIDIEHPDDIKPGKRKVSFDRRSHRLEKEMVMKNRPSNISNVGETISVVWKGDESGS